MNLAITILDSSNLGVIMNMITIEEELIDLMESIDALIDTMNHTMLIGLVIYTGLVVLALGSVWINWRNK